MLPQIKRFEDRVARLWPGWKTKILALLAAIQPLAALVGYYVDPQAVTGFIEEGWQALMGVQAALVVLIAWARRLTDVYGALTQVSQTTQAPKKKRTKKRPGGKGGGKAAVKSLALVAVAASVALAGCAATSMEQAAKILAERPPETCTRTIDGETLTFTGAAKCEQMARAVEMKACADFSEANEPMCVLAVALDRAGGSDGHTDAETQLLVTAMQQDGANRRAWISTIPIFGNIAATVYQAHESQKTLRTAFRNGGTSVGSVNVTKSDDGMASSGEGSATGTGGNGDQYVTIGSRNQAIPGDGSIISDGRNPVMIGTGQPNSSLDPSTANNQSAGAPENPINNAPVVRTSDDDGGQSIVPGF